MPQASTGDPERFPRERMLKGGFKVAGGHREVEHGENVMQRSVTKAWRLGNSEPSWGTDSSST